MRIAFCTNNENTHPTARWLHTVADVAIYDDHKLIDDCDLIVSYNYRYIVPAKLLNKYPAINLHMSLLPWNRGAHPIVWAAREGTPFGVTIHEMTPALDRGNIIAQREIQIPKTYTLKQAYQRHQDEMLTLLQNTWQSIVQMVGSYHHTGQLGDLSNGWDTTIEEVRNAPA
jgi:methionyl-tRNA formyltransferase